MEDESINIEKLKSIFGLGTGERTIEVTEGEYKKILDEAMKKKLKVIKESDSFSLLLGELTIKITCDYDEDDEFDEDDDDLN